MLVPGGFCGVTVTNLSRHNGFLQFIQGASKPKMRNRSAQTLALLICTLIVSGFAAAQSNPESTSAQTGWTSYAMFGGTFNSLGQVFLVSPNVGYNFSQHFGMDAGLPLYYVHASSSTMGSESGSGAGNPFVDLRWKYPHPTLNYATVLTGAAPLGDSKLGLSTGRATFDWANHFDHPFNEVTPFLEAGLSNTTADSREFLRPYMTLGLNTHFRGGMQVNAWKSVSVGGAGYDILPFGDQTVFSRVTGATGKGSSASQGLQNNQQTTGTASIAVDNGFQTWVDASLNRYLDAELGFTRSVHYALNSISFSLGLNVGRLLRESN